MAKESLGDRLVAGAVSAVLGALIGCVLAWIFGVYSNTMGAAGSAIDFMQWALWSAGFFGLIGLLLGSHAGAVVGTFISGVLAFEGAETGLPSWVVVVVFVAAIGVWWWLTT